MIVVYATLIVCTVWVRQHINIKLGKYAGWDKIDWQFCDHLSCFTCICLYTEPFILELCNKMLSADVKFSSTTLVIYTLSKYHLFDLIQTKKNCLEWRKSWPPYAETSSLTQTVKYYQVKVGLPGEWSIISWRLSSRPGLEPPELELEPATFRQALGFAFALRSANFMVGPPTVTPKLLTFFVKGLWLLIRTENMLDQVVVSILVRTCLFLSKKGISTTLISRIFLHVSTFFKFSLN